ncbi:hypothetical protein BLOT_000229 [Blomia tropicalis]|nr:hypothetical protein BLOT_000229 [Blomia tropicalis]
MGGSIGFDGAGLRSSQSDLDDDDDDENVDKKRKPTLTLVTTLGLNSIDIIKCILTSYSYFFLFSHGICEPGIFCVKSLFNVDVEETKKKNVV